MVFESWSYWSRVSVSSVFIQLWITESGSKFCILLFVGTTVCFSIFILKGLSNKIENQNQKTNLISVFFSDLLWISDLSWPCACTESGHCMHLAGPCKAKKWNTINHFNDIWRDLVFMTDINHYYPAHQCGQTTCSLVWPQHLIDITGSVLPGQAAGEVLPNVENPALKSIFSYICTCIFHSLQKRYTHMGITFYLHETYCLFTTVYRLLSICNIVLK